MRGLRIPALLAAALTLGCAAGAPSRKPSAPSPQVADEPQPRLSLAERLPADTQFFMRLAPDRLLGQIRDFLRFVDARRAEAFGIQAERAWRSLLTLAEHNGFRPDLLDALPTTPLHLVGLTQREELLPTIGLVFDCGSRLAAGFIAALKQRIEQHQAEPPFWRELPVDTGALVQLDGDGFSIGRADGFLFSAEPVPRRLWQALNRARAGGLADAAHHIWFSQDDPAWFAWLDLQAAAALGRRGMEKRHQQALRQADELGGVQGRLARQAAEEAYRQTEKMLRVFGIDRLSALGGRLVFELEPGQLRYGLAAGLTFREPLPEVPRLVLDSGRAFRLPATGLERGLAVLWRLDLAALYRSAAQWLPEESLRQQRTAEAALRAATGYDIQALLSLLAGDFYLLLTPGEQPTPAVFDRMLLLLGIRDRQATERALIAVYETLARDPQLGAHIEQRAFQGRTVFLLGPPGPQGQRDPASAVVLGLLDDHLALGGWPAVTGAIRRQAAGAAQHGSALAALVQQQPRASLLVLAHRDLLDRLQRSIGAEGDEPAVDAVIADLHRLELSPDGDPAERELRDALVRLLELGRALGQRAAEMSGPGLVLRGQRREGLFELVLESSLRR
jgi:hypothetical protein